MSAASAHTNYISHTPERDSSSGSSNGGQPSLLARAGAAAQSVLQTLSFGAASSLLPTLNGPSGSGGRRFFGGSLQEGGRSSSARTHFTGLGLGLGGGGGGGGARRKRTAGALLGVAIDNDPLVIAEDEAFHRRVVQVLLLVGVLMLLFVGATAIIALDAPADSAVAAATAASAALQPADPLAQRSHDMRLAQLDSPHEDQLQQHEQQQEHEQQESSSRPAVEPASSYAEHEQQQQQQQEEQGHSEASVTDAAAPPYVRRGSTVPDPSEATSAEDEALAAEAQRHVAEQEALAQSGAMAGHDRVRREADRMHEEEFQRQQLRLMRLREEQERMRAEEEEAAAAAAARAERQEQRHAPPPRRYGPLCTHVLARHADLYGSLDARAPPLAQLAQRSAVALAGPALRIRDRQHARGAPRQLVHFQPRDLHTPLGGRAIAEQIGALRAALAAEQEQDPSASAAAAAAAGAVDADGDLELVGAGFVDAQALQALPESEWRRFALPESPPYDERSGEPLAWDPATDHGEVWIVGAAVTPAAGAP